MSSPWGWGYPVHGLRKQLPPVIVAHHQRTWLRFEVAAGQGGADAVNVRIVQVHRTPHPGFTPSLISSSEPVTCKGGSTATRITNISNTSQTCHARTVHRTPPLTHSGQLPAPHHPRNRPTTRPPPFPFVFLPPFPPF